MTSQLATAIALLLYGVGLLPFFLIALRPNAMGPVLSAAGVAAVAGAFVLTGIPYADKLASTDVGPLLAVGSFGGRCAETFEVLTEAGLVLAPPRRDGLVVNGAGWDQLPVSVQEAILECAVTLSGAGQEVDSVPLIRR